MWRSMLRPAMPTRGKTSSQPPAGFFCPLPVPNRPWFHIALDFATRPPPSKCNILLYIIDCFSKAIHFVPLPKLSSALETEELITCGCVCRCGFFLSCRLSWHQSCGLIYLGLTTTPYQIIVFLLWYNLATLIKSVFQTNLVNSV